MCQACDSADFADRSRARGALSCECGVARPSVKGQPVDVKLTPQTYCLTKKSFLPRKMGMHANTTKKTASNNIEFVGIKPSITFPKMSPRINEYAMKRIVRKSKRISLAQYLHALRSQNGDGKINISQIFTACLPQCGHRKNLIYFPSATKTPTL